MKVDAKKSNRISSAQSKRAAEHRRQIDRRSLKARNGGKRVAAPAVDPTSDAAKFLPATAEQATLYSALQIEKRFCITPVQVSNVIRREHGLLMHVAKALKIPLSTLKRYVKARPQCAEACIEAREKMGDVAEAKLFDLIKNGDVRCLLYYLSTVHRNRGYGLRPGESPFAAPENRPVHVETINIVAVPEGQFIPKPQPPAIEHE